MGSCEKNPSPINLCESLMGQVVNNAVNSEEWRRASSSLLEIYAADLSDGEVPRLAYETGPKAFSLEMFPTDNPVYSSKTASMSQG
jgi:predicted aconitase